MYKPHLTQATRPATVTLAAIDEQGNTVPATVAGEHPLTVYLDKREIVTLMTLGTTPEALVLGYLRNQRLVAEIGDIASVQVDWETGSAAVTTHAGSPNLTARMASRTVTSGCGQGTMFGDLMENLDSILLPETGRMSEATLMTLLDNVRRHESIYKQAGAVHGCALAESGGEILMFVEDVGRHNAVDAIAGRMWLEAIGGGDKIFYTTGRLTSEMVIKAAQMGIPFLISRSGLTAMAHAIAVKVGLTLIGRAQGRHYLLFAGQQRFSRGRP
ncbi:MAG: formate dehydrogenase accessory sulfurtransferase FdhD [Sterolibacterium sp.]